MTARLFALCLAVLALTVTGAAPPARAYEAHVLRYADEQDVVTLNPMLASSGNIAQISALTLAFLTRIDAHAQPIPELATVVPSLRNGGIARDGKTITWHLRRGVRWSDGAPFDADDVVYTANVLQNRANNIVSREGWEFVTSVTERDKYTVVFHLSRPFAPYFETYFGSDGANCILPKHILGASTVINQVPWNALPVGIGPFRYTSFKRGDSVTMEANPYYWRGRPKLNKIVYKLITDDNTLLTQLQTGELDLWFFVNGSFVDRVKQLAGKTTQTVPSPYVSSVFFNTQRPSVADRAVRDALRYATDRNAVFDKVVHHAGFLQESFLPSVTQDYDGALPHHDLNIARANEILDKAGWKRGSDGVRAKNGVRLSIELAIPSGYQPSQTLAELLRDTWGQAGAHVDLHAYSTAQFFAPMSAGGIVNSGKFDAALLSQSAGPIADALNGIGCAFFPPHGLNHMRYCNHAVDAALAKYNETYDDRERKPLADFVQKQVDDDVPEIVMYERAYVSAYDARLKNYHSQPFSPYDDFMNVDI